MSEVQTKPVELKSRPDLKFHVRSLPALADCDLREQVGKQDASTAAGEKALMAALLAAYVVNPDGSKAFADPDAALGFMATAQRNVCWKLIKEGQAFNELTDEAIEAAEKN
jgi:hypothetical protein